jgi:septal ring factor EnvC (AmiA/AmiB activator)
MKTGIQFIETFDKNGITHNSKDKRFQDTLDFQDFVGHMNKQQLRNFYKGLDQSGKRTFIWACCHTLHFETTIDIIKSTTIWAERIKLYDQVEKDIAPRENKLAERELTFHNCKKPIHKKIASLNSEIESLKNRLAWSETKVEQLQRYNNMLYKRTREAETKSSHFDNVRAALALILDETI